MQRSRRNDLGHLIREEMVQRFEDVVKEEIRQHQLLAEKQDRRFDDFDQKLSDLESRLNNSVQENKNYYLKTDQKFKESIDEVIKTYEELTQYIGQGKKEIDRLCEAFNESMKSFVNQDDLLEIFKNLNEDIKNLDQKIENKDKLHDEKTYKLVKSVIDLYESLSVRYEKDISDIRMFLDFLDRQTKEFVVDAKGVLKELQVYKKDAYIQEKKIENLYTQIERLKGDRGDK